jgi:hypothetical protein
MKKTKDTCRIPECDRTIHIQKHSLCKAHYTRYRKFGSPMPGVPIRGLPSYDPKLDKLK